MDHAKEKYLRVLSVELEDLLADLQDTVQMHVQRNEQGEITNYVLRENTALLESEIAGIRAMMEEVGRTDVNRYADLDALAEALCVRFRETVHHGGYPDGLLGMIDRRCRKARRYVEEMV